MQQQKQARSLLKLNYSVQLQLASLVEHLRYARISFRHLSVAMSATACHVVHAAMKEWQRRLRLKYKSSRPEFSCHQDIDCRIVGPISHSSLSISMRKSSEWATLRLYSIPISFGPGILACQTRPDRNVADFPLRNNVIRLNSGSIHFARITTAIGVGAYQLDRSRSATTCAISPRRSFFFFGSVSNLPCRHPGQELLGARRLRFRTSERVRISANFGQFPGDVKCARTSITLSSCRASQTASSPKALSCPFFETSFAALRVAALSSTISLVVPCRAGRSMDKWTPSALLTGSL